VKPFTALAPRLALVPASWRVARLRDISRLIEEEDAGSTSTMLSLSSNGQLTLRTSESKQEPSADYREKFHRVAHGDLVVNPMWLAGGGLGVAFRSGAVSPEYRVYRFDSEMEPRFVHHLFRSEPYLAQYKLLIRADTTFDRRVTKDDFRELPVAIPPASEQRAIADFLDRETARIDALITAKRRMIEVLEERRQTYAAHAVTHGRWGDSELVATGNEFAPLVPKHWQLVRLKNVSSRIVDTAHKTAPEVPGGEYLVVRTANVKGGRLVLSDARYTDADGFHEWTERAVPQPGDIMFTREAPAGEACLVPDGLPLCIGQRMVLIQTDPTKMLPKFGLHSLYGGAAQEFVRLLSRSTTVAHLNMSDIPDIPITLPPLDEQESLIDAINREAEHLHALTDVLARQIDLLVEHRQAMITAAVTGELNVGVAA